ncbi:MAG: DUF4340 domain-containing protein [Treponema sp.]|jgi:hypothetical protein|nr:DUF4340 domain-containing protein [Treponema sp.]
MDKSNKYNKKIALLGGLVGVLALLYTATLLFDPEQVNARGASFTWLEAKWADQADRIELSGSEGDVTLIRKNNVWFVFRDNTEYPAKQLRIEDLLRILSAKGSYPVRGTAASSHERLGLALDSASRIVIRSGGAAYPLLDLLLGNGDSTGKEIYLRKNGEQEVRSGEDKFSGYVDGRPTGWFNLRVFPEEKYPGLTVESIQRVTVYAPPRLNEEGGEAAALKTQAPLVLTRYEGGWTVSGVTDGDNQQAETYIRSILEAEGEDFVAAEDGSTRESLGFVLNQEDTGESSSSTGTRVNEGRILLELGNGQTLTLRVSAPLESNLRSAWVEGSPFRYALAEWTLGRLFKTGSYFERQ